MRNGDGDSAVRILSVGDADSPDLGSERPPRRWFVPIVVLVGVAGLFVAATRPSGPDATPTTQPARIAAVDAEHVDFSDDVNTLAQSWESVPFDGSDTFHTSLQAGSVFLAVDSAAEPSVWTSGTGKAWRKVGQLELPEASGVSLEHAVVWAGDIVALGSVDDEIGVWKTMGYSTWDYLGIADMPGSDSIDFLVSGPSLLAVSGQDHGWTSTDGTEWVPLSGMPGLGALALSGFTGTEDHFFAFGADSCSGGIAPVPGGDPGCRAVIERSDDGAEWETTRVEADVPSMITSVVASRSGLAAAGWVGTDDGVAIATWHSEDGSSWERTSGPHDALRHGSVLIEAVAARGGANPWAELAIDGTAAEVAVGTTIDTAAGLIEVGPITDTSVELLGDAGGITVELGESTELIALVQPGRMAAEGSRLIVVGELLTQNGRSRPAAWLSNDSGATWERHMLGTAAGSAQYPMVRGANLVIVGVADERPAIWRAEWGADAVSQIAEELAEAYLEALDQSDPDAVVALLPTSDRIEIAPSFMTPTLGEVVHEWWDPETGDLVPARVADTVAYLGRTRAQINVTGCTSNAVLGVVDRVNVRCEYIVSSELLDLFGGESSAVATALVRDDVLTSVHLDQEPSIEMWRILGPPLADPSNTASVAQTPFTSWPGLEFTPASVLQHRTLAETYLAGLLTPGGTVTSATEFGMMEWTWMDAPEDLATFAGTLIWSEQGFISVGYQDAPTTNISFWRSNDGLDWDELPSLPRVTHIWNVLPFADGFVAVVFRGESPSIAYFDGTAWTEAEIPTPEGASYIEQLLPAVSNDQLMVMATWFSEEFELVRSTTTFDSDLSPTPADSPAVDSPNRFNAELAGTDTGFVFAVSEFDQALNDPASMSLWTTEDGQDWSILTESVPLEDAQFVWNLRQHRSDYFVVGQGSELRCVEGTRCDYLLHLWSSPDGRTWREVLTDKSESISSYQIGEGPLGLVAFGEFRDVDSLPRTVYMSTDGREWVAEEGIAIQNTDSANWWLGVPAISEDMVLAIGASFPDSLDGGANPFMIVGRVIDG